MKNSICIAIWILLSMPYVFGQLSTLGSETQVNTTNTFNQQNPDIAINDSGDYIVVWEQQLSGGGYDIYAQRYNAAGTAQGVEFIINSTTTNDQRFPQVAMDNSGGFVVVWQSLNQDGAGWGIIFRRFSSAGTALVVDAVVNSTTADQQRFADIAMDDTGNYVIVWESEFDVYLRCYNNAGAAQGGETLVNTTTASSQNYPSVAMDTDGDFVVVWQSLGQDGSDYGIYGKRYDGTGAAQGGEIAINATTADNQLSPVVAMDDTGAFAVAWTSNTQDGSQEGIYARRFDGTGTALAAEFVVNTTTVGAQNNPAIAMSSEGAFAVAWNSYAQDGSMTGVYQQGFDETGTAVGSETVVNTSTTLFQQFPSIGLKDKTTATIVWQDGERTTASSTDGEDYGVFQQRYDATALPVELLSFEATKDESTALLNWETATEINNDYFDVEWSKDGTAFKKIGLVNGAGTSYGNHRYEFRHETPVIGVNYYRLRQVDFDGAFEYTEVRTVKFDRIQNILITPNPVRNVMNIETVFKGEIYLLDNRGTIVIKRIIDGDTEIEINDLPNGVYYLRVGDDSEKVIIHRGR
ncbi:MAG: hypothetical protein ACI94Y_003259 [Maribacter sp.]|jgi:hypothetical protein